MAVAQQQRQLIPFRLGTRQRFQPVATVNVADNSRQSVILPRVGFLSHVFVQIDATITNTPGTGSIAFAPLGPWNLLRSVTVRTNLGTAILYRTSGWTNYLVQRLTGDNLDPAAAGDSFVYAASTASGDQTLRLPYVIPVAANLGDDFVTGLYLLQSPEVQVTVDLEFGALVGDAFTVSGGATVVYKTGTQPVARVGYLYYEVPDPNRVMYPPLTLHRIIEDELPISSVGDVIWQLPREGLVLRLGRTILNNTPARSDAVTEFVLRANRTDEMYRIRQWEQRYLQLYRYGGPLPSGVYVHDLWAARNEGSPGWGDVRDAIDSEAIATVEDITRLDSTFTPGSNAKMVVWREFLQAVALGGAR